MPFNVNKIPGRIKQSREQIYNRSCEKIDNKLEEYDNLVRHKRNQWICITKNVIGGIWADCQIFPIKELFDKLIKEYRDNGWEVEYTNDIFEGEDRPLASGLQFRVPIEREKEVDLSIATKKTNFDNLDIEN